MTLTPIKIAALLAALVGVIEAALPLVPEAYRALMQSALPFLALLAGTLAPQVRVPRRARPPMFPPADGDGG